MPSKANHGPALLREIEQTPCATPRIWWLGHSGFALKYRQAIFFVDPCLTQAGFEGSLLAEPPLSPESIGCANLVLATHLHPRHFDPETVHGILAASPRAKLVLPKSGAEQASRAGVSFHRMVTTDNGLRIEHLDDRIYSVPSAHDGLDWTPLGGYPHLGYLIRFGTETIYHAGDCVPYEDLADRLRPYNVKVALLPVSGRDPARPGHGAFDSAEAANLAAQIGAEWLVPMHYGMFPDQNPDINRFVEHMLGQRPELRFKLFSVGEGWSYGEESDPA